MTILLLIGLFFATAIALMAYLFAVSAIFEKDLKLVGATLQRSADEAGLQSLNSLPGVLEVLPEEFRQSLTGAHQQLRIRFGIAGAFCGFITVGALYLLVVLLAPASKALAWGLLVVPFIGCTNIGARGLRADVRLGGPVYAVFNQLFSARSLPCRS